MIELVHAVLTVLGFLGAQVADPGPICAGGACPEVPHRPVVAWSAPQTVRADEVRLFAHDVRRPGCAPSSQADLAVQLGMAAGWSREVLVVPVARERLVLGDPAVRLTGPSGR
jgi:hypothetical protein